MMKTILSIALVLVAATAVAGRPLKSPKAKANPPAARMTSSSQVPAAAPLPARKFTNDVHVVITCTTNAAEVAKFTLYQSAATNSFTKQSDIAGDGHVVIVRQVGDRFAATVVNILGQESDLSPAQTWPFVLAPTRWIISGDRPLGTIQTKSTLGIPGGWTTLTNTSATQIGVPAMPGAWFFRGIGTPGLNLTISPQ